MIPPSLFEGQLCSQGRAGRRRAASNFDHAVVINFVTRGLLSLFDGFQT
jgi:hypothetical protein